MGQRSPQLALKGQVVEMTQSTQRKKEGPAPAPATSTADRDVIAQVHPLAEALCDTEGLELVHIEYHRERGGRVMRLYIDKPGGVTLEDCATVNRELGDILDVHLPEIGPYHLEVSSPGLNRPLGRAQDFERFVGCTARIRILRPIDGQKNFSGVLEGVAAGAVRLNTGQATVAIPIEDISKAYLTDAWKEGAAATD
jgi:ribosome maturation factor RimP